VYRAELPKNRQCREFAGTRAMAAADITSIFE
jgi:hypothetical protein